MKSLSNNLFNYATSELSQDAFICYLMSFLLEENIEKNKALNMCAVDLVNEMLSGKDKIEYGIPIKNLYKQGYIVKGAINKQYKNIDVYLIINDWHIIVEDKTYTYTHNNQIDKYSNTLIEETIPRDKIITVYYKIIEQSEKEESADVELYRDKILKIFKKYYDLAKDKIFTDYVEYLESIDQETKSFNNKKIENWTYLNYVGFLSKLINDNIIHNADIEHWGPGWGYVSNPNGGFMGLWWIPYIYPNLKNKLYSDLYLQIENNKIALKIYNHDIPDKDKDKEKDIINGRWNLRYKITDYIDSHYSGILIKSGRITISSRSTTFYYVIFDENNYADRIYCMENLLRELIELNHKSFLED